MHAADAFKKPLTLKSDQHSAGFYWTLSCWLLNTETLRPLGRLPDPMRFNAAVVKWLQSVADIAGDIVSIDGKLLRRALTKDGKMPCIVSAHSSRTKLVIGQIKANEKSNEITAIPNLLELLYLKGAIITIDAAGCQKKIVRKIMKRDAGYIISLKGNQTTMHEEIKMFMNDPAFKRKFKRAETVSKGHGRVETRTCWQTDDLDWFSEKDKWEGALRAKCFSIKQPVISIQQDGVFRPHFTGRCPAGCRLLKHFGRRPPKMHWILDMDFDEDRSRARMGNIAENLAMLRHVVLNVLRLDKSIFGGISVKRKELTWDDDKLFRLMLAA